MVYFDEMKAKRSEIEAQAAGILAELGITEPPVNTIFVANKLGFVVRAVTYRSPDVHGSVAKEDGLVEIDVRAEDPPVRRRFTIAHEIGHAVRHLEDGTTHVDSARFFRLEQTEHGAQDHEVEANQFAAALLMPEAWVRDHFASWRDPVVLAIRFGVSADAMKYRLRNLALA